MAHYDALLVAYYLARAHGVALRKQGLTRGDGSLCVTGVRACVLPLVSSHRVRADTPSLALEELRRQVASRRSLVLTRDTFRVDGLQTVLARCTVLDMGTETTLLDCTELRR